MCVGQHGVAGAQSLHIHISSQGGGSWVGQSLSWWVLLGVFLWRPGCHGGLQAGSGWSFPRRVLQPSISSRSWQFSWGAAGNIRAEDGWISKRSQVWVFRKTLKPAEMHAMLTGINFINMSGNSKVQLIWTNKYLACMMTGGYVQPHPKKEKRTTSIKKWVEHVMCDATITCYCGGTRCNVDV